MTRYGQQYGPDFTFLGVPALRPRRPLQLRRRGRGHRRCSVRRRHVPPSGDPVRAHGDPQTDYLPHDGSRPSLALRTDGLADLRVVDAGDVEMYSGDIEVALPALEAAVEKVARAGAIPVVLGGDHSIAFPDAKGVANVLGHGRVSMIHFDAHADTGDIEFGSLWGTGSRCGG